jgi:hypothetical protein
MKLGLQEKMEQKVENTSASNNLTRKHTNSTKTLIERMCKANGCWGKVSNLQVNFCWVFYGL